MKETIQQILIDQMGLFDDEPIKDTDNLFNDLNLDSLDIVELAIAIEREYNISIDDLEIENWKTVKDICDTIEKLTE